MVGRMVGGDMLDGMRVLARVILDETPRESFAELPRVLPRSTRVVSPEVCEWSVVSLMEIIVFVLPCLAWGHLEKAADMLYRQRIYCAKKYGDTRGEERRRKWAKVS